MSLDFAIIGIVFALILVIIFFSAIVLYLAFRVKETFRKETRKGVTVVKVGFLIGVLFLAGGIFYFFANTLGSFNQLTPNSANPYLNLTVSYPSSVKVDTLCTVSFTVLNPTNVTAHGVTIQAVVFFSEFKIESSKYEIVGNSINIGDVQPGTTIVSLNLLAPNKTGTISDTVTLRFEGMTAPVTEGISVSVGGGPGGNSSPSPTPSSTPVLELSVSSPTLATINSTVAMSFTIINPTNATAHAASIETGTLFSNFKIISSDRTVVGNVMNVGDVLPGLTVISLQLQSPSRPGTETYTSSLLYQEMTSPVTYQITISVRGGP